LTLHKKRLKIKNWADAIYHAYAGFVNGAKALLLSENEKTNHQAGIITYLTLFSLKQIKSQSTLKDLVFQINKEEPSEEFARKYIKEAIAFF
jgi:sulfite reductase (ferredoxin)